MMRCIVCIFFFFNDTATTEIYTLSLHDALPISHQPCLRRAIQPGWPIPGLRQLGPDRTALGYRRDVLGQQTPHRPFQLRSEEHTSELQSRQYLVCRLLLEKKKKTNTDHSKYDNQ